MAKNKLNIKKVLLLGSGALKIGEAGEFDYSGSQAAKALREEGVKTILVNPNIATIQTSKNLVDKVYFLPVTPYFVEKIIQKELPDGILLGFGGQTALNTGMELYKSDFLKDYNVQVLGTPVSAIIKTEDRLLFRKCITDLGLKVPLSVVCHKLDELSNLGKKLIYPVMIRAGFSLGGLGSGVAYNFDELYCIARKALTLTPQILIEEYLEHWKEIEYEIVRDKQDNTIIVCNMENLDPMGIHTGESIVVAPSQTLTNNEYQTLREITIKVVKSLSIIGECNIQYALSPRNGEYRIIEVNARLSRSSALASKATGYPLAYIAAKLALGYALSEIKNQVTKATCAFFEPALDFVVVKIPRWDFLKFKDMEQKLGSEMQSVGEVMAIGRTFEEALQKGVRSLDLDYEGIISDDLDKNKISAQGRSSSGRKLNEGIKLKDLSPTPNRLYNIAYNIFYGQSVKEINKKTGIDIWFLERIENIVFTYKTCLSSVIPDLPAQAGLIRNSMGTLNQVQHDRKTVHDDRLTKELLLKLKKLGFSDKQIGEIFGKNWLEIRKQRKKWKILPKVCQIDTLAGEFPAKTNYLYLSYHRSTNDIDHGSARQIAIIGGGPYQIGSSVEFDWCAVTSAETAKKLGFSPIMINCNPETVSTDYDASDKLYFEELTLERILDIYDFEKCPFIVSVGGQTPNTLAPKLAKQNVKFLCNKPATIDKVENRRKFSAFLDKLTIKQPIWDKLTGKKQALTFAGKIGYPVLIRPSYVLSGRAMFTAYSEGQFSAYLGQDDAVINSEYPLVISKFIRGAKEVDFDGVAQNGQILVSAISEHVEHAGVHSGDATLVLPSFSLNNNALDEITKTSQTITSNLPINGPFNIQYLVNEYPDKPPEVLVIEANLRASRSFPFVSKVLGVNFIELATKIMLGQKKQPIKVKRPKFYGVKVPHFSFTRLRRADPVLRVEMASTGEVACFGDDIHEAYLKAILATGIPMPRNTALLALGGDEGKERLLPAAKTLNKMGYSIYATRNTSKFLSGHGIKSQFVYKVHEQNEPNVVDLINQKKVSLVINLSDRGDLGVKHLIKEITDGFLIRRAAVDANIPLFTKATIANLFVEALAKYPINMLKIKSWEEYTNEK